jgi:hypothetical protein
MERRVALCTIIAKNYIAHARTLVDSFREFHPEIACYVLIVDEFEGYVVPADEQFEVMSLRELELPKMRSLCFKYNVTELCTATKPFLLEHLLQVRSIQKVLYIDPDVLVTGRLTELYAKLDSFDIVLTPHVEADFPDDGLQPDDSAVLQTGLFNLGFIGVRDSQNTREFLGWWKGKLQNKCVVHVQGGLFVDQKFIDLASVLFENIYVEKCTGYNVAYWNLHSRKIGKSNGMWMCNGGPLYFFHFSGYQQDDRESLTTHIPKSEMRYRLTDRPELREMFSEYAQRVESHGYAESHEWPYTFATFANGKAIPYVYRKLYREYLEEMERYGDPFLSRALMRRLRLKRVVSRDTATARLIALVYRGVPGLRSLVRRLMRTAA